MNGTVVFSSAALVLLFVTPASADVFERDWKTPGDGLLTYDDVNQREWLDLSVSRLDQFPEPRLENAVAEIAPGGLFEGFTWAKRKDVTELAQSAGIDTTTTDLLINETATRDMIALLGATVELSEDPNSIGFIDDTMQFPSPPLARVGAEFRIHEPFPDRGFAGLIISSTSDLLVFDTNGLMLYRNVPEGGSILSILTGVILVSHITRRYVTNGVRPCFLFLRAE